MKNDSIMSRLPRNILVAAIAVAGLSSVGCQMDVGGQTLPSPYYVADDVQYFPPGPEFKLAREAAAMNAYAEDEPLDTSFSN